MKYECGKPEWAENEPCPIDTGELEDCAECYWARERDVYTDWFDSYVEAEKFIEESERA